MCKWYDKPTKILSLNKDIDYVMCINLIYALKQISNKKELTEDEKTFTITGCIFTKEDYFNSEKLIKALKNKYWYNGLFYDSKVKTNKAICFHSRDIRKHNGCFNDAVIKYDDFIVDLSNVMKNINCKIISISINLYEYLKRGYTHNVYNVAFDFLLERYIYIWY